LSYYCFVFLSQGFKDIFSNAIPSGLPPIRGIEHQIDLVYRALIPHQPIYRSNSKKIKELQKQVEEFITKRYIRENISPYVVLVLLVLKKDVT